MWFKNGLKAQKLLAQGSALGYYDRKTCRPVRAKAFKYQACNKAFALTGRRAKCCLYPGRCPGLGASTLSGRVGQWLLLFAFLLCFCFKNYLKIRVVSLSLSNSS